MLYTLLSIATFVPREHNSAIPILSSILVNEVKVVSAVGEVLALPWSIMSVGEIIGCRCPV